MSKFSDATTRFKRESPCPDCGYLMDSASGITGKDRPSPGDVSLCMKCGAVNLFDEDMAPRKCSVAELIDIQRSSSWPLIQRAQKAIGMIPWKK